MNDGRPSSGDNGETRRSWLERLGQALQGNEPKDKEDLIEFLHDAHKRHLIDGDALDMLEGVLSVSDMQVRDIMIPRSQMVVVEREQGLQEFLPMIIDEAHSRFPVIGESRDEVLGILLAKDLLPFVARGGDGFDIREVLRPAVFVPESKRLNVLLREFRTSRNHMAIVVDEYGGVAGMVTIEDVMEQIVGEIEDEHDIDEDDIEIQQVGKGRHTVRALISIEDFNEHFGSAYSDEEFDTIGGLLLSQFGHMPKRGEIMDMDGLRFKVLRADSRRLHLVEVTKVPAAESGDFTGEGIA
ncbi:MAG: magnesium/cobalt efflux protein [Gammaproteobacteria bacterium HGW-Gammaproteobacteria-1]|jgi:magnesium and cobalt transporter|nr:MAG: magnesium/cobalt efflux protein [Gammaproteobacteria bacterium HGW-Gammaproteobacteria-1]